MIRGIDGNFAVFAVHSRLTLGQRGWSMRQLSCRHIGAICLSAAAFLLASNPLMAACISAMNTPQWPTIARSIRTVQLCEQIPVGPNHTARFQIVSLDACQAAPGVSSIVARALLTCESGSDSILPLPPFEGEVTAAITLDTNTCMIRDTNVQISGDLGMLLSGLNETQQFARDWAQTQLSSLCRLH
jgi:hypothetical protein